jgi:hypothetical protein
MDDIDDVVKGRQNLVLGTVVPYEEYGRKIPVAKIPVAGVEEKAILGLFERWYSQDGDAKTWNDRYERRIMSHPGGDFFADEEPEEQRAKAFAVKLMRKLKSRN